MMDTEADKAKILDFVKSQFKHFLGFEPVIFGVSNKKAIAARLGNSYFQGGALELFFD
jgi:hypothetical protein